MYDLILTGTSFASSFFLKKYLELAPSTVRILVLERGSFLPHSERLEKTRKKPRGKISFVSGGDTKKTFVNENPEKAWIFDPSFGGSSNSWTGCTPRLMPNDFRLRSKYNVGEDWPLSYEDLEPYYCEAEEIMSIAGPEVTPFPRSKPYPLPAHALSSVDKLLQKEYGDLHIGQPTARSSVSGQRNRCCTSSVCHMCPTNAKFTIENGLMSIYEDPRVEVSVESQVISLDMANDVVKQVVYRKNGKEFKAAGEAFALGANPIFNAHILLNSGDTNPATGHYLSEQIGYPAYVYLDGLDNVGGGSIITANGYMLYDTVDRSKMGACFIENHNSPFLRHEKGKWRQIARFKFIFEDIPQYENQVATSDDPTLPVVRYKSHSSYADKGYQHLKGKMEELLSPLPVEKVYLEENPVISEGHILGTTRMSADPASGVIDKHLRHHQFRNLFVLGSSSFPTISPANPTLTLSALSLWAAQRAFGTNELV